LFAFICRLPAVPPRFDCRPQVVRSAALSGSQEAGELAFSDAQPPARRGTNADALDFTGLDAPVDRGRMDAQSRGKFGNRQKWRCLPFVHTQTVAPIAPLAG
jgi:hypothetical protein